MSNAKKLVLPARKSGVPATHGEPRLTMTQQQRSAAVD